MNRVPVALLLSVVGCASCFAPPPARSIPSDSRLSAFPTEDLPLLSDAEVLWNDYQVPYILADNDDDVAFLLGMIHGHLRRTQIEMYRRIVMGRLSEIAGPIAWEGDHMLRAIDLDRAADEIAANLPLETRRYLERYVLGLNVQAERAAKQPYDLGIFGIDAREFWSVRDVIAVSRLTGVDVGLPGRVRNAMLLREERGAEFLARLESFAAIGTASFGPTEPTPLDLMSRASKSGSNSFAVAGARSASGGALLASDPHLGFVLPNFWCLVGYHTPVRQAVGLTWPGVPVLTLGRNQDIAWGGTNMSGNSSVLYDLSDVPVDRFWLREESISTRFWFDTSRTMRESEWGPVISDMFGFFGGDLDLPTLAIDWRGHRASDEVTAFLRAERAADWDEFRSSFSSDAVAGQSMLFADRRGHIGQLLALDFETAHGRAAEQGGIVRADPNAPPPVSRQTWSSPLLPSAFDPSVGYLVSANNTPVRTDPPVAAFRNADDRARRIGELLERRELWSAQELMEVQRDVYSRTSHATAGVLAELADQLETLSNGGRAIREAIELWDGQYTTRSVGAAVYQVVLHHLLRTHYEPAWGEEIAGTLRGSGAVHDFVREDLAADRIPAEDLLGALEATASAWPAGQTWGDLHRLRLVHPLAFAPWIGGDRYRFVDRPIAGSSSTIAKSSHTVTDETHTAFYGAQARHVSDLADPDANWFLLLGGQDGWLGSANYVDQVETWLSGESMIQMPLTLDAIRRAFPYRMELTPR